MAESRGLKRRAWPALAWGVGLAGLAYRIRELGRYGFWNDEAWVALSTRVQGVAQFRLSLGPTPVLWAATLRLLAPLPLAPEVSLRLLPLLFSGLTLWLAFRTGRHLVGALGGLLALGAIAFDPGSILWAKLLKQYSAEAFLALLAFHRATVFGRSHRTRDLVALGLTLSVGVALANAQLFVGPPLLGALLADAIATEDWPRARAVVAAGVAVGAWDLAYFKILVAPHLTASLAEYWDNAYVTGSADQAARFVVRTLQAMLGATWSGLGMVLALPSLVALFVRVRATRPVLLAIVLLIAELAWLSSRRLVPFNASRVMLFLLTVLNVHLAMAFGFAASQLWSRRALWPLAPLLLALLVRDIAVRRNWASLGLVEQAENLGPLVRIVEESRRPEDAVLVYDRSVYVYAYYQGRTPVLVPAPGTTVGFAPLIDDPGVSVVDAKHAPETAARAFDRHPRVWLLGSRFRAGEESRILRVLRAHGRLIAESRRERALLLLLKRRREGNDAGQRRAATRARVSIRRERAPRHPPRTLS